MKKFLFIAVLAAFGLNAGAQNFSGGVTVGLPVGDAGDAYTFNIGLDVQALWEVSESFDAGVASGYNHSFGDSFSEMILGTTIEFDVDDYQYIPLAAAGRYSVSEDFTLGADLGYAIAVGEGDGGFYYRPMVGYNVAESTQITASYRGVSVDGGTFTTINLGVNFGF